MMATKRATSAEKAQAWDRLMDSTKNDSEAIEEAWTWLDQAVLEREREEREERRRQSKGG
jgi:hypothetical protein